MPMQETGWIPGWGRLPEGEQGNPLQYSCLENPMDGGAWRATVHGVTKRQLKRLSTDACKRADWRTTVMTKHSSDRADPKIGFHLNFSIYIVDLKIVLL